MESLFKFEPHYQRRVLSIEWDEAQRRHTAVEWEILKKAWVAQLKSWHYPYTALVWVREHALQPDDVGALRKMVLFLKKFHLRKIHFINETRLFEESETPDWYVHHLNYEEAGLCLEGGAVPKEAGSDFKSLIQIENDFNAHVMEISFLDHFVLSEKSQIKTLQTKVTNHLKAWHSPYSLLIDCSKWTMSADMTKEFESFLRFLKAFFCKVVLGYSPKGTKEEYPFVTFRSRHLAAAQLEHEGITQGSVANCSTRREK